MLSHTHTYHTRGEQAAEHKRKKRRVRERANNIADLSLTHTLHAWQVAAEHGGALHAQLKTNKRGRKVGEKPWRAAPEHGGALPAPTGARSTA